MNEDYDETSNIHGRVAIGDLVHVIENALCSFGPVTVIYKSGLEQRVINEGSQTVSRSSIGLEVLFQNIDYDCLQATTEFTLMQTASQSWYSVRDYSLWCCTVLNEKKC